MLITITFPSIKTLKNIVDRMKTLSNFLILQGNKSGELTVKIETDLVVQRFASRVVMRDLVSDSWEIQSQNKFNSITSTQIHILMMSFFSFKDNGNTANNDHQQAITSAEVRIDIKKFAQFLNSQQAHVGKVICNLANNRTAHIFVLHEYFTLQCLLPSIAY
ncbi:unnamed protein product [Didymodactylos carnosus]|uniref:Checkpoint protein n=1 Tax=Didymodactylos carnosus TaxID=1234261 RepID=A0A814Z5E0_9BILA|nr:unnamed protein product [Didymodactylos carnosus]CAF1237821.1 unnamed protein product [Didymodactylos carnosus]CAF3688099.1 unnamed protein product [Didymodactylos carnosus]CAF4000183.1 unnamed protein product [Didymodactylos carnosus]